MKDYKSNLPQGTKLQYVMQIAKWEAATHDSLINDHIKPHYTQKSAQILPVILSAKLLDIFFPKGAPYFPLQHSYHQKDIFDQKT